MCKKFRQRIKEKKSVKELMKSYKRMSKFQDSLSKKDLAKRWFDE